MGEGKDALVANQNIFHLKKIEMQVLLKMYSFYAISPHNSFPLLLFISPVYWVGVQTNN